MSDRVKVFLDVLSPASVSTCILGVAVLRLRALLESPQKRKDAQPTVSWQTRLTCRHGAPGVRRALQASERDIDTSRSLSIHSGKDLGS